MKCETITKATRRGDIVFVNDSFMIYLSHNGEKVDKYLDIYRNKIGCELYLGGWDINCYKGVAIFRKSSR